MPKIIIIATDGLTTRMLYNGLPSAVEKRVILENPESKSTILKRRRKKLGLFRTLGQVLFMVIVHPFIPKKPGRIKEILEDANISPNDIPSNLITNISSVSDPKLATEIEIFNPDLIVINGTRILSKQLLKSINCPIVNIHVGITPQYRGVHGGYWALKEKNPQLYGVTLHYVDEGIDTGRIIAQKLLKPTREDNFKTYPIQQYAGGIELLNKKLDAILKAEPFNPPTHTSKSELHYHPTLLDYLFR